MWHNRDFVLLWGGQTLSTLGTAASSVVYPLLILALTDSPAKAGVTGALRVVPYVLLSLPVGALIDRWNRKRVMILCDIGRGLTLLTIPIAMALHVLTIWQLYAAALVEGSLFVLFNIAEVAALPQVVGKEALPEAAAQNEVAWGVANVVGPSIGTYLYQAIGSGAPFVADAMSYGASVISLRLIKTEFQQNRAVSRNRLVADIKEGLSWLWNQPLIRFMALITGGCNFAQAALPLLLIVLAKSLGATDAQVGLVFSLGSLGAIAGSLVGGFIQRRFSFGAVITSMMWVFALACPLFALAPSYLWLGAAAALMWVTGPIYNVVQFSYRLAIIPDAFQGRVNSVFRLFAFGLEPLGALLGGLLIQRFGTTTTVIVLSVWLVFLALMTTFNRHVRHARPLDEVAAA